MSNEIEVGEYIRCGTAGIRKVTEVIKSAIDFTVIKIKDDKGLLIKREYIKKHSKNIIDLIECGDFVNGHRVTDKYLFAGGKPVLETEGNDTNCKCLCEKDIKIILTKEIYMANCYKVGGRE